MLFEQVLADTVLETMVLYAAHCMRTVELAIPSRHREPAGMAIAVKPTQTLLVEFFDGQTFRSSALPVIRVLQELILRANVYRDQV